jgi:hypothetical protein
VLWLYPTSPSLDRAFIRLGVRTSAYRGIIDWTKKLMATPRLTDEIIEAAILGFEEQHRRLDAQLAELRAMRCGNTIPECPSLTTRRNSSPNFQHGRDWLHLNGAADCVGAFLRSSTETHEKCSGPWTIIHLLLSFGMTYLVMWASKALTMPA